MQTDTAHRINRAALRVWFAWMVFGSEPMEDDLRIVRSVSQAQLETANDIAVADWQALSAVEGQTRLSCALGPMELFLLRTLVNMPA